MKPVILATLCHLIFSFHLPAQTDSSWTVKASQEIKEVLSPGARFRYPEFVLGNVYFKDGTNSQAPLNLNLLNEEMQFINAKGDTLSIANEGTIKYLTINNDTFYYSKVYLELVMSNSLGKIAKKQRLKIGDVRKIGGYDQPSSVSAITSYTSIYNRSQMTKITPRAELLLSKETVYYLGDNYNHFLPANKKNLMKKFGRKESVIENFLQEKKIRFNNENDLKMLIDFLQKIL